MTAVALALAVVGLSLTACSPTPDRQAAIPWDAVIGNAKGADSKAAPCADYSEEVSCVMGPEQSHITVLNGSSVLFAGAGNAPASTVVITKTCWSPAGEVDPIACASEGNPMAPGLVTQTTIAGFPAVSFAAVKIPDPSPDAPQDGVYPLPAVIGLTVDGRDVVIEIACCTSAG